MEVYYREIGLEGTLRPARRDSNTFSADWFLSRPRWPILRPTIQANGINLTVSCSVPFNFHFRATLGRLIDHYDEAIPKAL